MNIINTLFARRLILAGCAALFMVSPMLASAQQQQEKYAEADISSLPSGQLQQINWEDAELTISGKVYVYNREALTVYYEGKETDLASLGPDAVIHFQTANHAGSTTIVRIWVSAGGLIPS